MRRCLGDDRLISPNSALTKIKYSLATKVFVALAIAANRTSAGGAHLAPNGICLEGSIQMSMGWA
jgi:hypothetical protein